MACEKPQGIAHSRPISKGRYYICNHQVRGVGVAAYLKLLLGFMQCVQVVPEVYVVAMPEYYTRWVHATQCQPAAEPAISRHNG